MVALIFMKCLFSEKKCLFSDKLLVSMHPGILKIRPDAWPLLFSAFFLLPHPLSFLQSSLMSACCVTK
jgi:hypothetical protein